MLVLSRKTEESVLIGSDIQVRILSINKNRVRIGIDAPSNVRVIRSELVPPSGHDFPEVTGQLLDDEGPVDNHIETVMLVPR